MTSVLEVPKTKTVKPQLLLISELDQLLGGVREVADMLGMTRANVSGTAKRRASSGFPDEVGRWRMGPGYLLDEVRAWAGYAVKPRPKPPKRIPRYELIDVKDINDQLGGSAECAEMLGVSHTQGTTLASRWKGNGYPEPVWQPGMGSAWFLPDVWDWFREYDERESARQWKQLPKSMKEMLS